MHDGCGDGLVGWRARVRLLPALVMHSTFMSVLSTLVALEMKRM